MGRQAQRRSGAVPSSRKGLLALGRQTGGQGPASLCWAKGETVAPGVSAVPREASGSHSPPQVSLSEPQDTRSPSQPWTGPSRSWRWAPLHELGLGAGRRRLLPQGWGFQGLRRVAVPVTGVRGLSTTTELPDVGCCARCCWGSGRHLHVRVTVCEGVCAPVWPCTGAAMHVGVSMHTLTRLCFIHGAQTRSAPGTRQSRLPPAPSPNSLGAPRARPPAGLGRSPLQPHPCPAAGGSRPPGGDTQGSPPLDLCSWDTAAPPHTAQLPRAHRPPGREAGLREGGAPGLTRWSWVRARRLPRLTEKSY